LPHWLVEPIGRVAVERSDLEWQLEETLRILMAVSEKAGRIVSQGMRVRARVTTITNFVQAYVYDGILPPQFLRTWEKVARDLQAQR